MGYWKSKGAPLHKLLLGTPFYGRSFTLSSENSKSPGSRSSGPGKPGEFTDEAGFLAYYEICRMIKDGGWTEETDSDGNPYIYKVIRFNNKSKKEKSCFDSCTKRSEFRFFSLLHFLMIFCLGRPMGWI